ncbi:putative AC transposase [Bienertia sinuspersici]
MKKPKTYKWQKNDGTETMARHLRIDHGLSLKGEKRSGGGGQAQLHGYAFDMPGGGMPFVYNRETMINEFRKFVIAEESPFSFGESPNYEYFNRCDEYDLRKKVIALDAPTRWNSTYKLLHDAIAYRDVLTDIYNESRTGPYSFITDDHWSLAMIIHDVLQTFDNATHIFSYVYEPNIHMVILECIEIIHSIKLTSEPIPILLSRVYLTS